jgi:hypothetical protein
MTPRGFVIPNEVRDLLGTEPLSEFRFVTKGGLEDGFYAG